MRVFLIRHGETEHNVAGLLAGVTDSKLTNHGVLQAERLGQYLVMNQQLVFTQIYASDLQRAERTANSICVAQNVLFAKDAQTSRPPLIETIVSPLLREQDFGSFELLPWNPKDPSFVPPNPLDDNFKPKEPADVMSKRADDFLDDFIWPLLAIDQQDEQTTAIVSHGLFLAALWRALLVRFGRNSVIVGPDAGPIAHGRPLEHLGAWTNTGYLELEITMQSPTATTLNPVDSIIASTVPGRARNDESRVTADAEHSGVTPTSDKLAATMKILRVNSRSHLSNLKRTRWVGSSAADDRQQKLETFFKKPNKASSPETVKQ